MKSDKFKPSTREEIAQMARQAGLDLPSEYLEELVDAYAGIEEMLSRMKRGRERGDEPAHVFDPRKFMPEL